MRISKQVVPPDGWKYKQGEYTLKAESFDSLYSLVKAHRNSNGIVEGNIIEDIEEQLAENNPTVKLGVKLK